MVKNGAYRGEPLAQPHMSKNTAYCSRLPALQIDLQNPYI